MVPKTKQSKRIPAMMMVIVILLSIILPSISLGARVSASTVTGLFAGKYGKAQIFDVQRNPDYPTAGEDFVLSSFANIFDSTNDEQIDWGTNGDRYVQFIDTRTKSSENNPSAYTISLNLYEANGDFVKTISEYGTIWGIGDLGFFYEGHDRYGYFISNKQGYEYGSDLTYTPDTGLVTSVEDLNNYAATTAVLGVGETVNLHSNTVLPTIITSPMMEGVTSTSAYVFGEINGLELTDIIQHGFVWSTSENPDITVATKTEQGPLTNPTWLNYQITNLTPGTTYYLRTYATTSDGTAYSQQITFTTKMVGPVLNNGKLKFLDEYGFGPGYEFEETQSSVNSYGNLAQPFYYGSVNGTLDWYQLTNWGPLNSAIGVGGDGSNNWNLYGDISVDSELSNQIIDSSDYVQTGIGAGHGTMISTGDVEIDGKTLEVRNTYILGENSSFIKIVTKITNKSEETVTNLRYWTGTRDDYIGMTDVPKKERGNLVNGQFEKLQDPSDRAAALQVSSEDTGVLFYSTSPKADVSISYCCSFSNATNQDPSLSPIDQTGDGSYALFIRMNDLEPEQSEEFTWYYAAGELDNLGDIVEEVEKEIEPTITVPAAPTNVTGVRGDREVTVSFTAPANNGGADITGYTVTAYTEESDTPVTTATGTESPITVTGLENGKAYTFTITAKNSVGDSDASAPTEAVTPRQSVLSIDDKIVKSRSNIELPVVLSNESKAVALQFDVEFDSSRLTLEEATTQYLSGYPYNVNQINDNKYRIIIGSETEVTEIDNEEFTQLKLLPSDVVEQLKFTLNSDVMYNTDHEVTLSNIIIANRAEVETELKTDTATISLVDDDKPTVSLSATAIEADGLVPENDLGKKVRVDVAADDVTSNIVEIKYAKGNLEESNFTGDVSKSLDLASATFEVAENGDYTVYAKDEGGNVTIETISIDTVVMKGDANLDKEINLLDWQLVANFILEIDEPTPLQFYASDINDNDKINVGDWVSVANKIIARDK